MTPGELEQIERESIAAAAELLSWWRDNAGGIRDLDAANAYANLALAAGQRLTRTNT